MKKDMSKNDIDIVDDALGYIVKKQIQRKFWSLMADLVGSTVSQMGKGVFSMHKLHFNAVIDLIKTDQKIDDKFDLIRLFINENEQRLKYGKELIFYIHKNPDEKWKKELGFSFKTMYIFSRWDSSILKRYDIKMKQLVNERNTILSELNQFINSTEKILLLEEKIIKNLEIAYKKAISEVTTFISKYHVENFGSKIDLLKIDLSQTIHDNGLADILGKLKKLRLKYSATAY